MAESIRAWAISVVFLQIGFVNPSRGSNFLEKGIVTPRVAFTVSHNLATMKHPASRAPASAIQITHGPSTPQIFSLLKSAQGIPSAWNILHPCSLFFYLAHPPGVAQMSSALHPVPASVQAEFIAVVLMLPSHFRWFVGVNL